MKIGIFGGTFNPVHNGHLSIADEFVNKCELDKLILIPNNVSPFKIDVDDDSVSAEHRMRILKLAVQDRKNFEIDDFEITKNGVSYTIETVEYLKSKFPEDHLFLLIGIDQAIDIDRWKDIYKIKKLVSIVVADRTNEMTNYEEIDKSFIRLGNTKVDISSSEIRDNVRSGKSILGMVPDEVAVYIVNNMLYF